MELVLKDIGSRICVSNGVYGSTFNESLVHQVITSYQAGLRQGTHSQKSRANVSGSGKKPWKQKGTGRARSGAIRSPIWRSGGVAFAAQPMCYKKKVNKKMYRGALRSIFSELVRQDRLIPVSEFFIEKPRTKLLLKELKRINLNNSDILIIIHDRDKNLFFASRNLYKVKVCHFSNINPFILVAFNMIVMTVKSIESIEDILI